MITKSISGLGLAALVTCAGFSGACSQTPAKAPGSNPQDMTAAGHREAAEEEAQAAEQHEQQKANVGPSKPNIEENQRSSEEQKAQQHRDYARQHNEAADIVEQNK